MESALAWQENIRFENFLIEMMDLEVDGRVPTSEHIAPMLANNGWNLQEVASIWTVSSAGPPAGTWNDSAIEKLAGKGAVNRIWNSLNPISRQASQRDQELRMNPAQRKGSGSPLKVQRLVKSLAMTL